MTCYIASTRWKLKENRKRAGRDLSWKTKGEGRDFARRSFLLQRETIYNYLFNPATVTLEIIYIFGSTSRKMFLSTNENSFRISFKPLWHICQFSRSNKWSYRNWKNATGLIGKLKLSDKCEFLCDLIGNFKGQVFALV